jgi:hypothetical protein
MSRHLPDKRRKTGFNCAPCSLIAVKSSYSSRFDSSLLPDSVFSVVEANSPQRGSQKRHGRPRDGNFVKGPNSSGAADFLIFATSSFCEKQLASRGYLHNRPGRPSCGQWLMLGGNLGI